MRSIYIDMKQIKTIFILFAVIILVLPVITGCNGSSDIINGAGNYKYTLQGLFVQDVNLWLGYGNYNHLAIKLQRDSVEFNNADVLFSDTQLVVVYDYAQTIDDSVYTFSSIARPYLPAGDYTIDITDSTFLIDSIMTMVVDTCYINNYIPDSTIPNTNGTETTVEWASAANVDGYVVAVVLADSAYGGYGYATYITDQVTSTTLPPDAFRANPNQTLDTGMYYIYVYGYTGTPDSALSSKLLPVPFPSQLNDNISHVDLSGHFGSVIVSRRVPLHVVSQ